LAAGSGRASTPATASVAQGSAFIQVNRDLEIAVDNAGLVYEIGQHLPLIQKNDRFFIAVVPNVGGAPTLAAFPRLNNVNKGTGWITYEREIVFGASVRSCAGTLYLHQFDRLPLVGEGTKAYHVLLERNGQRVLVEIPKTAQGIEVVRTDTPPASPGSALAQRSHDGIPPVYQMPLATPGPADTVVFGESEDRRGRHAAVARSSREPITLNDATIVPLVEFASPRAETPAESPATAASTTAVETVVAQIAEITPETSPAIDAAPAAPVTQAAPVVVAAAATETLAPSSTDAAPPEVKQPLYAARTPPWTAVWSWLAMLGTNTLLFKILLATVIAEGILLLRTQRRRVAHVAPAGPGVSSEVMSYSSTESTIVNQVPKLSIRSSGDLSGTFDAFSVGQVVQFFSSAGESGTLYVSHLKGAQKDELVFDRGRIIDARSGEKRGEDAVNVILRMTEGSFVFRREDVSSHPTTVQQETMALLLEAHRQMDEQRVPT
jgi:hypothetical protein